MQTSLEGCQVDSHFMDIEGYWRLKKTPVDIQKVPLNALEKAFQSAEVVTPQRTRVSAGGLFQ